MKVERFSAEQIQYVKKRLRQDMAGTVREIYQSWGLTGTRFCGYMGAALQMSTERVYQFLCTRKCISEELMEPGKLPIVLEEILAMYEANERVDSTAKEKVKQVWNTKREQQLDKIDKLADQYSVANKVSSFRKHDYDLMEDLEDDLIMHNVILNSFHLLEKFLGQKWPEDFQKGLSYEETVELRNSIGAVVMSNRYLSYMRKKYRNYKKQR